MCVTIWEYLVRQEHLDPFLAAYRPGGTWADLFSRSPEYVRTELCRDRHDPRRFVTIDYWKSGEAHELFRVNFAREYDELDHSCAAFTDSESFIGSFQVL